MPMLRTAWIGLVLLAGCLDPTAAPRLEPEDTPPVPLRIAWLGTYDGAADGAENGVQFRNRPVRLQLELSRAPDCINTLHVRFEPFFDGCGFDVTSAISASFELRSDSALHRVVLDRFSGGGQIGNVLLGSIRVEWLDSARADMLLVDATFTVVRR